jgi:Flp pilus assembly protein TadG
MPSISPFCKISTFVRDERGSQTIEFILWIPMIMMLLVTVIDAATLYFAHAEMENIARDTARRMVTGAETGTDAATLEASASAYAGWRLDQNGYPHTVTTTWHPVDKKMIVNISTSVSDVAPFGYLIGAVLANSIVAQVAMRANPDIDVLPGGG